MIGVIATIRVKDGKAAAFEQVFRALATEVRAKEPGVLVYEMTRSRTEANLYKAFEIYRDQATVDAHGATDYFRRGYAELLELIEGEMGIEMLDVVFPAER